MNPLNVEKSLQLLKNQLDKRTFTDKSYWLIDIGKLGPLEQVKHLLNNLQLDLDDDIYLYNGTSLNNIGKH